MRKMFGMMVGALALLCAVATVSANGYKDQVRNGPPMCPVKVIMEVPCDSVKAQEPIEPPTAQKVPKYARIDRGGHDGSWMQKQGFTSCGEVRESCGGGANKPGHGLKYSGVCEDRYQQCLKTGCWHTTNTGHVCHLARR